MIKKKKEKEEAKETIVKHKKLTSTQTRLELHEEPIYNFVPRVSTFKEMIRTNSNNTKSHSGQSNGHRHIYQRLNMFFW